MISLALKFAAAVVIATIGWAIVLWIANLFQKEEVNERNEWWPWVEDDDPESRE